MRKIKKINGYLIVKFNTREIQKMEQLGAYGVIDAELYTGHIELDRGAMEYEDAETLEIAIAQARGLDSEFDVEESPAIYTLIKETNNSNEVTIVDPVLMANEWEETLQNRIDDEHCPEINPETAWHEFLGFTAALSKLGMYTPDNHMRPYQPWDNVIENFYQTVKRRFTEKQSDAEQTTPCNKCPTRAAEWQAYNMDRALSTSIYSVIEELMTVNAPISFSKRKKLIDAMFSYNKLLEKNDKLFSRAYTSARMKFLEHSEEALKFAYEQNNRK